MSDERREEIFSRLRGIFVRVLRQYIRREEDIEDIVQEALKVYLEKGKDAELDLKFGLRILHYKRLQYYDAKMRERQRVDLESASDLPAERHLAPDRVLESCSFTDALNDALGQMSGKYRLIITRLYALEGPEKDQARAELMRELGIDGRTLNKWVHRAKLDLKRRLIAKGWGHYFKLG